LKIAMPALSFASSDPISGVGRTSISAQSTIARSSRVVRRRKLAASYPGTRENASMVS
jgi:hypothetical protein